MNNQLRFISEDESTKLRVYRPHTHKISFTGADNKEIGALYLESPIRFEGDTEASAQMFFEHVVKQHEAEIKRLKARVEKLEGALHYIADFGISLRQIDSEDEATNKEASYRFLARTLQKLARHALSPKHQQGDEAAS